MAAKDNLTPDAYERQVAGLIKNKTSTNTKGAFDDGIYLKLYSDQKEQLKTIPDWTNKLRIAIAELIEKEGKSSAA